MAPEDSVAVSSRCQECGVEMNAAGKAEATSRDCRALQGLMHACRAQCGVCWSRAMSHARAGTSLCAGLP